MPPSPSGTAAGTITRPATAVTFPATVGAPSVALLAEALFAADATARKEARAKVVAAGEPYASRIASDKRSYHAMEDDKKIYKLAVELAQTLGIDGATFACEVLARFVARDSGVQHALAAALAFPGNEAKAFGLLAGAKQVSLSNIKRHLPPGLGHLAALESLSLQMVKLTAADNMAELASLPNFANLDITWCKLLDVDVLSTLPLRHLEVTGPATQLKNLGALAKLTRLESLIVGGASVDDLGWVSALPLRSLTVSHSPVPSLEPLAGLAGTLRTLRLAAIKAVSFAPLAALTELEHLDLEDCAVDDFGFLASMPKLRSLNLHRTGFADLTLLANHRALERLDLGRCPFDDLAPLSALPLESLYLSNRPLPQSLAPLEEIASLRLLALSGCGVDEARLAPIRSAIGGITIWS